MDICVLKVILLQYYTIIETIFYRLPQHNFAFDNDRIDPELVFLTL